MPKATKGAGIESRLAILGRLSSGAAAIVRTNESFFKTVIYGIALVWLLTNVLGLLDADIARKFSWIYMDVSKAVR
jgi:hypothetical protein